MSNASATCNGHNLNADIGDAAGTSSNCGVIQNSNVPFRCLFGGQWRDHASVARSELTAPLCGSCTRVGDIPGELDLISKLVLVRRLVEEGPLQLA
jgi:hypothetical protein